MKILLDTNVVLDILLKRDPFFTNSFDAVELSLISKGRTNYLFVSASAITDIYYIANRNLKDKEKVKELIYNLLSFAEVADVISTDILIALESNFFDFEDAVVHEVAASNEVDVILTRNKKDFSKSTINVKTPEELIQFFIKDES